MSIIHSRELTRNRTRESVQTRSRSSTEMNRERIEETIDERGKITGISKDPHQTKKVFKENISKSKVDGK